MEESIIRVLQGAATDHEIERVQAWRNERAENEAYFRDLARLWRNLPDFTIETTAPRSTEILEKSGAPLVIPVPRRQPLYRRIWAPLVAAAAVAALALVGGELLVRGAGGEAQLLQIERISTGAEESHMTTLSDGTIVYLAPNSSLLVSPKDGVREVWLDGKAFFAVAGHGPDWPFVVRSDRGEVQVLGTRFEFSTLEDDLRVLVVEGRVNFRAGPESSASPIAVAAGQIGLADRSGETVLLEAGDLSAHLAWMGNTLVFENTPLAQAVREIETHFGAVVELRSEALRNQTISGGFRNRSFFDVVATICRVLGAACVTNELHAVITAQSNADVRTMRAANQ